MYKKEYVKKEYVKKDYGPSPEWLEEQKQDCFDKMVSLQSMMEDNPDLFNNVIDTETLQCDEVQSECLSYLMKESTLTDLIEYLLYICKNARKTNKGKYGAFAYIAFNGRIFYINKMVGKTNTIYQFVLVNKIPQEDEDIVPFDIVEYGLEPLSYLFKTDLRKCVKNASIKYGVVLKENEDYDLNNIYNVTKSQVTYKFDEGYDKTWLRRLALIYFCAANKTLERPISSQLLERLMTWDAVLKLMNQEGFDVMTSNKYSISIKNRELKKFINEDICMFFRRYKGLFETIKENNVSIVYCNGNAHVSTGEEVEE